MTDFMFGDFAPGLASITPGRSAVIDGVVPIADGSYGPMSQLVTVDGADALAEAPRGYVSFPKADGTYVAYVATSTNWYSVGADGALTSIASGHSVPSGDDESFVRFGDKLLGTNVTDGLRSYDFETSTDEGAVSGAPAARFAFVVGDVVVLLDCDGDNRLIRNSDINDHTNYTSGSADKQPVEDGGALIAGVAVTQGAAVILQRESIRLMRFGGAGGGALYSLSLISANAGAVNARSVVGARGLAFFLDTDGFKVSDGVSVSPIGEETGVSDWFISQVGADRLVEVQGAYDRFRQIVWWRFPISGDSTSVFSRMIGYHIFHKRWVTLTVNTSAIFTTALPGVTLDDLTDPLEDYDYTLDDRYFQGGEPLFAGFDADLKFATFSGGALPATLETYRQPLPRSRLITRITPDTDASGATVQLGVADNINTSTSWKSAVSLQASGTAALRGRGKVIQLRQNVPAGETWTFAKGFSWPNEGAR